MRSAFTLIELMVVMIILVIIMAMVIPKGSKMLDSFEKSVQKTKDKQKLSKARSMSFLQAKEQDLNISKKFYKISAKGVITEYEKSNDNY